MISLVWLATARAGCPATEGDLLIRVTAAEEAFDTMQLEPFEAQYQGIRTETACLTEVVTTDAAARIHRVEAMAAFLERDTDAASKSFRAQISASGTLGLPEKYSAEHPLHTLYDAAEDTDDLKVDVVLGEGTQLWVDGTEASSRPTARPALLQVTAADSEKMLSSGLYTEGETFEPPVGIVLPPPTVAVSHPTPPAPVRRRVVPLGLAAGAGIAAVATGVLYGLGASSKARYSDTATPYEDLTKLRSTTNSMQVGAQVTGGLALGLGGAAVLSGVF